MEDVKQATLLAMETLDLDGLNVNVQRLLQLGCDNLEVEEILQRGLQRVGDRFAQGEYFLADLIVSGMMFKSALEIILSGKEEPRRPKEPCGRVLIGVVAGDIHDIGKDIVVQMLQSEAFDVLDLGVDVPASAFVQAARSYRPDIIALSGVMGDSAREMKVVINMLKEEGILIPVVVGGMCVSELIFDKVGADRYAPGPVDTMKYCKQVMENKLHG